MRPSPTPRNGPSASSHAPRSPWAAHLLGAAAAFTIGVAPVPAASPQLTLAPYSSSGAVEESLQEAGLTGDLRMVKLLARLKAGDLEEKGSAAASQVSDEKDLASARMRVRSIQPYLDEAQRDVFAGKWKPLQAYLGVIFSQRDAIQTVISQTYPGNDPVALASKDALLNEGNNVIKNAEALSTAAKARSQKASIDAYAKLSLSYDRFLKAGDLYGNSLILPAGKRPKPKPKLTLPPPPPPSAKPAAQKKPPAAKPPPAPARPRPPSAPTPSALSQTTDKVIAERARREAERSAATQSAASSAAEAKLAAVEKKAEERLAAAEAKLREAEELAALAEQKMRLVEKAMRAEEKLEAKAVKVRQETSSTFVPQYDPVTSTESLFSDTPLTSLVYERQVKPRVADKVLVIAGPDKGRGGVLLGIDGQSAIVKLESRELKVIDLAKIAKQKPS